MVSRVGTRDEETVGAKDQRVVLANVVGRPRISKHLLELVLVLALVHVLFSSEMRRNLVGNDHVDCRWKGREKAVGAKSDR